MNQYSKDGRSALLSRLEKLRMTEEDTVEKVAHVEFPAEEESPEQVLAEINAILEGDTKVAETEDSEDSEEKATEDAPKEGTPEEGETEKETESEPESETESEDDVKKEAEVPEFIKEKKEEAEAKKEDDDKEKEKDEEGDDESKEAEANEPGEPESAEKVSDVEGEEETEDLPEPTEKSHGPKADPTPKEGEEVFEEKAAEAGLEGVNGIKLSKEAQAIEDMIYGSFADTLLDDQEKIAEAFDQDLTDNVTKLASIRERLALEERLPETSRDA